MSDWCIKLPGHIKSVVEKQARAEYMPAPDYVRQLVQRAVFEKQWCDRGSNRNNEPHQPRPTAHGRGQCRNRPRSANRRRFKRRNNLAIFR